MRLDAMRYFLEIVDMKSISKVSRKCGVPQQSLSSMLSSLENELNVVLIRHSGKKIFLTEEGKDFYQFCINFFNEYRKLDKELNPLKLQTKEIINIVSQNYIAQTVLSDWISLLLKYRPGIELNIEIKNSIEIIEDVCSGGKDLGFLLCFEKDSEIYPQIPEELIFYRLFSCETYFWVNAKNPLFQKDFLTLQMLESHMIIRDQNANNDFFKYILSNIFNTEQKYFPAANAHVFLKLVKEGFAVCPDLKTERGELSLAYLFDQDEDVKALPLIEKNSYKIIAGYVIPKEMRNSKTLDDILGYLN